MKYAMLHLDPCDSRPSMALHRINVYCEIHKALSSAGFSICFFVNEKYANLICELVPEAFVVTTGHEASTNINEYYSLAMQNSLRPENFEGLLAEYKKLNNNFDVIVTNTPSCLLRKVFEDTLILHYELGIFNRPPFTKYHQFDPFGYSWKSLLSKFPIVSPRVFEVLKKRRFSSSAPGVSRSLLLGQSGLMADNIGSINAIYFPIPSGSTWSSTAEVAYVNRMKYLEAVARRYIEHKIITNEKPQYPLSEKEWLEIAKLKNVQVVSNTDQMGKGSVLSMLCAKTYTFSPSLALQTLYWGNTLLAPDGSSMVTWANMCPDRETLELYLDTFHISDLYLVPEYLQLWQQMNPHNPKSILFL